MHKKKKIELNLIKKQVVDNYKEPIFVGGGIFEQINNLNKIPYNEFDKRALEDMLTSLSKQGE